MSTGKFKAKLESVAVTQANSGTVGVVLRCRVLGDDGKTFNRDFTGWLSEGAKQRTLDALATVGYQFQNDDLCDVDDINAYDRSAEFMVTVEAEEYEKDGQKKTFEKIQWINPIGSGAVRNQLAKDDAVVKIKGLSLGGDVMAMREKLGIKKGAPKTNTQAAGTSDASFAADDIPF